MSYYRSSQAASGSLSQLKPRDAASIVFPPELPASSPVPWPGDNVVDKGSGEQGEGCSRGGDHGSSPKLSA